MMAVFTASAIGLVIACTLVVGLRGLRITRSTSDFFVASRSVRPWWNASAISGEFLAAASFFGIAGLMLDSSGEALLLVSGYTAGFLVMLIFVASSLRRSNAYTVSDFAQARFDSMRVRHITSVVVVLICSIYIVPQLHAAALIARSVGGVPGWIGPVVVATVVAATVAAGGMRSITLAQGVQYGFKVVSLLIPLIFMIVIVLRRGTASDSSAMHRVIDEPAHSAYWSISLLASVLLGTAGLPHVLVRLCTSRDSRTAQRTLAIVVVLVGTFYLLPLAYGVLGRWFASDATAGDRTDTLVLRLPGAIVGGTLGEVLTAIVAAGAFSTFLATSSGLIVTMAGVVSQDVFGADVRGFRRAAIAATVMTLVIALVTSSSRLTETVGYVFALSASTLFPMLVLAIWSRAVTSAGVAAGMLVGGAAVVGAAIGHYALGRPAGVAGDLMAQPGGWSAPLAFVVMLAVSQLQVASSHRSDAGERFLAQLHSPEYSRSRTDVSEYRYDVD